MSSAREVARRVLARVERGGAWASHALDGELERSGLDERDRRLAAELVYGVLRHRSRIDRALAAHAQLKKTPPAVLGALRVAAYQLLFLRVPAHAAVDDAVATVRAGHGGARTAGFANAVLRKLASDGEPPLPESPRERLETEHSLPRWLADLLVDSLTGHPERGEAESKDAAIVSVAAAALNTPAPLWARVNLRRATREEVADALTAEGAQVSNVDGVHEALRVAGLGDPGASASFARGLWTVQDLGAQRIGLLANPRPGTRILDACAGVGGKSTHLAELTGDAATIDAADLSTQKLSLATQTAARLGHKSIRTITGDLLDPSMALAPEYDLVVLDAPCTGLGVLRRHPEAKWRLTADDPPRLAALQARLLDAMAARVAPGGALVYSVCTFTRLEGPVQAARFVERHRDFTPAGPPLQTWPHQDGADAFFAVRFTRS
jgi:16S rRNA (cytosine967-C5)-methyltransferase